jgi:hypothetical protein
LGRYGIFLDEGDVESVITTDRTAIRFSHRRTMKAELYVTQ